MSQHGNYTNIWHLENKIKTINKSNNITAICYLILILSMFYHLIVNTNRLNEQKRLLISQQEQINKLILNSEYNTLRYEKTAR